MAAFPSHVGDVLMGRTGTGPVGPRPAAIFSRDDDEVHRHVDLHAQRLRALLVLQELEPHQAARADGHHAVLARVLRILLLLLMLFPHPRARSIRRRGPVPRRRVLWRSAGSLRRSCGGSPIPTGWFRCWHFSLCCLQWRRRTGSMRRWRRITIRTAALPPGIGWPSCWAASSSCWRSSGRSIDAKTS